MVGSWERFCEEMNISGVGRNGIPQPLEPLRGIYISCQMKDEGIVEECFVNILATDVEREVYLWENARLLKIDGPKITFLPNGDSDGSESELETVELLLERVVLIQHYIKPAYEEVQICYL